MRLVFGAIAAVVLLAGAAPAGARPASPHPAAGGARLVHVVIGLRSKVAVAIHGTGPSLYVRRTLANRAERRLIDRLTGT